MSYPAIDFLFLNEEDMIKAGVKDMAGCIDAMEEVVKCLNKGDYVMGGENHNSHGCQVSFPKTSPFLICQKMRETIEDLWQCRRIWAAAIRWLE